MANNKHRKRAQRPKDRNYEMGRAFIELRQGSRTEPHRNRARYDRNDFRVNAQRGRWE